MKRWVIIIFMNMINFVYAQNTDMYFGGNIGLNFGLQDINKTYESMLNKLTNYNLEIERMPSFAFSVYWGYFGYTNDIAIQIGFDFNINEKLKQRIINTNEYSYLTYSYINFPIQLRIQRKIFKLVNVGFIFGPYISFPLGKIEEKSLINKKKYDQEITYVINLDQFITYDIKYGTILFLLNYKRDFTDNRYY
jgi:hypothetical protein